MNKKEVSEIKKQFTPQNCAITRVATCYVGNDGEQISKETNAFLSLPEEEQFKYFEIFKQSLAGGIGKKLANIEFPLKESEEQQFLVKLKKSGLEDKVLLDAFFDQIIASYSYPDNYLIIVIHGAYDVPSKVGGDSEDVYEYILTAICPMTLSKAGLSYFSKENKIKDRIRDRIVAPPLNSLLFPAFNNRSSDVNELLYYSKKEQYPELIETLVGKEAPLSSEEQTECFGKMVKGLECSFDDVKIIQETLKELPEDSVYAEDDLKKLFGKVAKEDVVEKIVEDKPLNVANMFSQKEITVKTPTASVKVKTDKLDKLEAKVIDGTKYLLVPIENVAEVNGIETNL